MAIALDDLCRDWLGDQAERFEGVSLESRAEVGIGTDRAGELADADSLAGGDESLAVASELGKPEGEG